MVIKFENAKRWEGVRNPKIEKEGIPNCEGVKNNQK